MLRPRHLTVTLGPVLRSPGEFIDGMVVRHAPRATVGHQGGVDVLYEYRPVASAAARRGERWNLGRRAAPQLTPLFQQTAAPPRPRA